MIPKRGSSYTPLSADIDDSFFLVSEYKQSARRYKRLAIATIFASLCINALLAVSFYKSPKLLLDTFTSNPFPQLLYSPASSAIEYKSIKFSRGVYDDIPIYEQAPSPEVDDAWFELYKYGPTRLTRSEAALLVNGTWAINGDPDHYITSLDVFHQLHCLDMLRQKIHPDYYQYSMPMGHLRHCVGVLRQAVMCFSDVSTISWQWNEKYHEAEQRDDVPHTCRNFDTVKQWAIEHYDADLKEEDLEVYPINSTTLI